MSESNILELTEGCTAAIEYQLLHNNAPWNASLATAGAVLKDKNGAEVDLAGKVAWTTPTVSKIKYSPAATDLLASKSPYTLHWKITDQASKVAFYPQGAAILVRVFTK
jgi:hypothetical protein